MKPGIESNELGLDSIRWASDGGRLVVLGIGAAGSFKLAYSLPGLEWLVFIYLACYDLSYRRITDGLVRQGARALIVPTMDVADWGDHEHRLHARIGPVRAAEYHLPIFRLASSGISQFITAEGQVTATAPYPGQGSSLAAELPLGCRGILPWDRWLAPLSVLVTVGWLISLPFRRSTNALPIII